MCYATDLVNRADEASFLGRRVSELDRDTLKDMLDTLLREYQYRYFPLVIYKPQSTDKTRDFHLVHQRT